MNEKELDELFDTIRNQLKNLPESSSRDSLLLHIKSLSRWSEEPMDYPDVGSASFPAELAVADAVCHPECGRRELIVDGSTQRCQRCGGLMFRNDVRTYELVDK